MTQPLALGIDIGGTSTSYGIVNRRGEILLKGNIPTIGHNTDHDFVTALKNTLEPVLLSVGRENVQGVGVGAPNGNFFTGEIIFAPNLPWKGAIIPLVKLLNDALHF